MLPTQPEPITEYSTEVITRLVGRVLSIEELTWGDARQNYVARIRGRLLLDSTQAYDQLSESLKPHGITPLFRLEEGRHTIILAPVVINPKPSNPWINLILFIFTLFSVLFAGALYSYDGPAVSDTGQLVMQLLQRIDSGIPFAASLLAILLAHEFGHYLAARYHKTHVTLPYFIPFPLSTFGTMGAFIQLKEPPRNKRILLDIGIAGPLAGLVVAIPVLFLGLYLSNLSELPAFLPPGIGLSLEGNSILYLISKYLVYGKLLPAPESYAGLSPFLYWIRYFFTGQPLPLGGMDVLLHPVAWAGWAGLLVTALNLIPAGQLDGGHVLYVLLGKRAATLRPFILIALVILGFVWAGWWLWAFLIFLLGRLYAEPLDQITTLDPRRRAIALLGLFIFFLVFTPVPLIIVGG